MIKDEQRFSLSPTYYSMEYKQMVCEHYLRGNKTKEEIRKDFGIKGKSSLLYWLRQLGYSEPKSKTELPFMAKSKKVIEYDGSNTSILKNRRNEWAK